VLRRYVLKQRCRPLDVETAVDECATKLCPMKWGERDEREQRNTRGREAEEGGGPGLTTEERGMGNGAGLL
jgi:hypothetical protein